MSKENILLITDDPRTQALCREPLSLKGYHAIAASDPQTAVTAATEGHIDLYLIDLQLRQTCGLDLLERIKGIQPEALAIILAESFTNEDLLRALHLGVKGFVIKPFRGKDLLNTTQKVLENHRLVKARIRSHVLNPLFEISESFLTEINLRRILTQIAEIAKKETHADLVTLLLDDPVSDELEMTVSLGTIPGDLEIEIRRIQRKLAQWVMENKEPLIIVEGVDTQRWIQKTSASLHVSSSICVPLVRKEKVIGVLHLGKKQGMISFTQNDLALATVLSRQAAVLIDNVRLFEEVNRKALDLEEAQLDAIKALAEALESKDAYTRDHSDRALLYAMAVAEKMGLSEAQKERLKCAAVLHDIGKIGVPENILKKPTKLTREEYEIMKTHPEKGAEIIKHIKSLAQVVPLVLYHQEHYDGNGYPKGLAGNEIPIESRIVAVLDAFDAMTSDRVYRKAPGRQRAIEELKRHAGTQFDPRVVKAFLEVIGEPPSQGFPIPPAKPVSSFQS